MLSQANAAAMKVGTASCGGQPWEPGRIHWIPRWMQHRMQHWQFLQNMSVKAVCCSPASICPTLPPSLAPPGQARLGLGAGGAPWSLQETKGPLTAARWPYALDKAEDVAALGLSYQVRRG